MTTNRKRTGLVLILLLMAVIAAGTILAISNKDKESESIPAQSTQSTENNSKSLTTQEVQNHSTKDDCWTIIEGRVYDITSYISRHPGGGDILQACGQDGTSLFTERKTSSGDTVGSGTPHSTNAANELAKLQIGTIQ